MKQNGFTLIELLVVIAIIAVLSVVVVLSLNPAELLRQSRDANRLSDLSTLNSALALYTTDQAGITGFSLGNASSVYISLPDSSSTCGAWNLPALPSGYTYACVASTSSKNIASTGWIPVNFSNISGGAPFSNLPIDGINQSSTGLYYTYYSNGSQFITTAIPESQKQKSSFGAKLTITNYPDVMANGSNLGISPLFNTSGLVGYWPMDEGTGTTANDFSSGGLIGTFSGTVAPAWAGGRVGPGALNFSGSAGCTSSCANYGVVRSPSFSLSTTLSLCTWIYPRANEIKEVLIHGSTTPNAFEFYQDVGPTMVLRGGAVSPLFSSQSLAINTWNFTCATINGTTGSVYVNAGAPVIGSVVAPSSTAAQLNIGAYSTGGYGLNGLLDDVRIYNRVLSPAEVAALYNAEK